MAPTKNTRSIAPKNSVTSHAMDSGVRKTFQCIICNNRHSSKAAISRHFKSHTTRPKELSPFTHPSCWDETPITSYSPTMQETGESTVESEAFDMRPSAKQRAIRTKFTYAHACVKNKKQLRQKEEQTRLHMLHWWFRVNEESLRARMEFGPKGLFPRQGEPKLQDQGQIFYINGITAKDDSLLELASAPPISQVPPLSAATAPTTRADHHLVSNPNDSVYSGSAETGFFDHDFDRSLKGSVIADFELASTRPLTSLPLLWCMSDAFTHFVRIHGESLITAVALQRTTKAYLDAVGVSQDFVDRLESRFDSKIIMSEYNWKLDCCNDDDDDDDDDEEDDRMAARRSNERRFREDRAFVWDVLEEAVQDYFNDYTDFELPVALQGARRSSDGVRVVVKATMALVERLGDERTSSYLRKYWKGKI